MFTKILKNRIALTLMLSVVVLGLLIVFSPLLHVLNKNVQNNYYSFKSTLFNRSVSNNIVVSVIDKETLDDLGRFPFERSVYADFIRNMEQAQVATIGFDIIFSDTTEDEHDQNFYTSLRDTTIPITFGVPITQKSEVEPPLPLFSTEIFTTGFLPPNINIANRTVYSFSPFLNFNQVTYEHFTLSVLRGFYTYLYDQDIRRESFSFYGEEYYDFSDTIKIPLSSRNTNDILISFQSSDSFEQISFSELVDSKKVRAYDLQDKIILVGTAVDGIKDEFFTPNGLEYGVFVHANILNTILSKNFLVYFDKKLEWLVLFLLVIISVYFNLGRSRKVLVLSNVFLVAVFVFALPVSIFLFTNLIMNYLVELLFALILSQTLSNAAKYLIEDKNKQKLKKSLSEYVGSDIAEEVLEEGGKINFDGEEKEAILFFSDIEGFTTISEHLSARKLVSFLREYLSQMSHIILDEKGYINKYEGDAIMALWGVFIKLDIENYHQVCNASLSQLELLKKLNKDWLEHYNEQIHIRIGIHAGEVIVGNIGAEGRKMEFTALGDTVNTASRLEGVNKFYGTHICASEAIYHETKNDFEYRFLDRIRVKGRIEPLNIYELVGRNGESSTAKKEIYEKYQKALDTYFAKDFTQAKMLFNELVDLGDPPSLTFKSRCSMYLLNPPEQNWDGVWQMEAK